MSKVQKAIDKIRQLRKDLNEEIDSVDNRITELRNRKSLLEQMGVVPVDEAVERFEKDLESMASKGREKLRYAVEQYSLSKPTIRGLSTLLEIRSTPSGLITDPSPVLAYLLKDQLLAEAREVLKEKCGADQVGDRAVPVANERIAELDRIDKELETLKHERDDLQDELHKSFSFEKSQRAKAAERRQECQQVLDNLNSKQAAEDEHAELD